MSKKELTEPKINSDNKEDFDEYDYEYSEFNDKKLEELSRKLGYSEKPQLAKEIMKFFLSLVPPVEVYAFEQNLTRDGTAQFPLPLYLYKDFSYLFGKLGTAVDAARTEYHMQVFAPEWYFEELRKLKDVELTNTYIIWVLQQYGYSTRNSERAREWWQEHFPWVVKERKKHEYFMRKISWKAFSIRNEGIKNQGDMIFMYMMAKINNGSLYNLFNDERYSPFYTRGFVNTTTFLFNPAGAGAAQDNRVPNTRLLPDTLNDLLFNESTSDNRFRKSDHLYAGVSENTDNTMWDQLSPVPSTFNRFTSFQEQNIPRIEAREEAREEARQEARQEARPQREGVFQRVANLFN